MEGEKGSLYVPRVLLMKRVSREGRASDATCGLRRTIASLVDPSIQRLVVRFIVLKRSPMSFCEAMVGGAVCSFETLPGSSASLAKGISTLSPRMSSPCSRLLLTVRQSLSRALYEVTTGFW